MGRTRIRFSPPNEIGTPIQRVEEDVHDEVKAQIATRMKKGFLFRRVYASGRGTMYEVATAYQFRQNRTFLTRWKTYTNDESGMIISVDVDWVWHGLP